MSKLKVGSFSLSLDGYGAGTDQGLQNPLGTHGPELFEWFFRTQMWQRMHGKEGGETGVDNRMAKQSFVNIGAWILGRNMFGPAWRRRAFAERDQYADTGVCMRRVHTRRTGDARYYSESLLKASPCGHSRHATEDEG
jgi:dihydrofolate reductase